MMKNKIFILLTTLTILATFCSCLGKAEQSGNEEPDTVYQAEVEQESDFLYEDEYTDEEDLIDEEKESDSKETEPSEETGEISTDTSEPAKYDEERMYSLAYNDPRPEQRFVETHLLEKMPELQRPKGYDDPVLTPEVATELLFEVRRMEVLLMCNGCSYDYAKQWLEENAVSRRLVLCETLDEYIFEFCTYVPALDTFEEFDEFFCQVFTERTVDAAKRWYKIYEYDGKLLGETGMSFPIAPYWNRIGSISVEQNGDIASVTVDTYCTNGTEDISDDNHKGEKFFDFIYSEKYGWRIDMEKCPGLDWGRP